MNAHDITIMNPLPNSSNFEELPRQTVTPKSADNWDTLAVARMIRENSTPETSPAFLYLGRIETKLLRNHLAQAFGGASVITLHETYYMGLKVISIAAESHLQTGGCKTIRSQYLPALPNAS